MTPTLTRAAADVLTEPLVTAPTAADRLHVPLDRFRREVRRREPELTAAGLVLRAGRHRLFRLDRLPELAALLAAEVPRA